MNRLLFATGLGLTCFFCLGTVLPKCLCKNKMKHFTSLNQSKINDRKWCSIQSNRDPNEIQRIDAQIEQLKEMKRGFEGRAIRAENQADRLQFEDQYVAETRRYYRIAEENREKAQKVQEEIDRLEAKKAELLFRMEQSRMCYRTLST